MCYILYQILKVCVCVSCFIEAGSPVAQAVLEFTLSWEMTLSSWFYLYLPSAAVTVHHQAKFNPLCDSINKDLHLISMRVCFHL